MGEGERVADGSERAADEGDPGRFSALPQGKVDARGASRRAPEGGGEPLVRRGPDHPQDESGSREGARRPQGDPEVSPGGAGARESGGGREDSRPAPEPARDARSALRGRGRVSRLSRGPGRGERRCRVRRARGCRRHVRRDSGRGGGVGAGDGRCEHHRRALQSGGPVRRVPHGEVAGRCRDGVGGSARQSGDGLGRLGTRHRRRGDGRRRRRRGRRVGVRTGRDESPARSAFCPHT